METHGIDLPYLLRRLLLSNHERRCPICDESFLKYGHKPECELAKALVALGETDVKYQKGS